MTYCIQETTVPFFAAIYQSGSEKRPLCDHYWGEIVYEKNYLHHELTDDCSRVQQLREKSST